MLISSECLAETLPDLVVLVRRDGVLLESMGGRGVPTLDPLPGSAGKRLDSIWPDTVVALMTQLTRRAIANRSTIDAEFRSSGVAFQVRVTAQGPDRAICVIRPASVDNSDLAAPTAVLPGQRFTRRGFFRRFKDDLALATLRETPLAVAVIHMDGIADISRIIDPEISEQIFGAALQRLKPLPDESALREPAWYVGPLSDGALALVIESAERDAIAACVARVCQSLSAPLGAGDASFHLTPHAGVAILGQDAGSAKMLLEHARTAAAEAHRSGSPNVWFTDRLRLRSLARLDITRELREAIANRDIRLRYVGRHDLATGRRVAHVGYLRWNHPLRGDIRPSEFLRVAEATGLARDLSRLALRELQRDFLEISAGSGAKIRLSFGALRHHILHEDFFGDVSRLISEGPVPADQLELRISERTLIAADVTVLHALKDLGVDIVVDEMGRGLSSLDRLARAGLSGMQLDRSWAAAIGSDPIALRVSRAALGMAAALGITTIATGVDNLEQRQALLELGCRDGMGDLYRDSAAQAIDLPQHHVSAHGRRRGDLIRLNSPL